MRYVRSPYLRTALLLMSFVGRASSEHDSDGSTNDVAPLWTIRKSARWPGYGSASFHEWTSPQWTSPKQ
jgi:hypothetical protein